MGNSFDLVKKLIESKIDSAYGIPDILKHCKYFIQILDAECVRKFSSWGISGLII